MENVVFIDYLTLLDNNFNLVKTSTMALKDAVEKIDKLKIVCLNTQQEIEQFKYDALLSSLSQALNLKKSLFFDKAVVSNWSTIDGASSAVSNWMKGKEVKSFVIVTFGRNALLQKAYPNNVIYSGRGELSEVHMKDILWILSNYGNAMSREEDVFFVSDTHFGHGNIIKYCNRPWNHGKDASGEVIVEDSDVLAMDNEMMKRWNSVVGKNDIVWHLGDFALGGKAVAERVFPQLNGKINLVMGNHDHWKLQWYYELGFHRVYDRKVIINDFVILSHAPLMFLNANTPFYNVFGHIHDSSAYKTWTKTGACVCVERHDYYPVSWKTIKEKYEELNAMKD